MSKKNMAVKNKVKTRRVSTTLPRVGRAVLRVVTVMFILGSVGWSGVALRNAYFTAWPVEQLILEGDKHNFTESDLIVFMHQQPERGLWAVDIKALQNAVKQLDWVKQVEIRKVWPNQLLFVVEEHQPVARFDQLVLTQAGTLIASKVNDAVRAELPNIVVANAVQRGAESLTGIWHQYKQVKREFELLNLTLTQFQIDEIDNWQLTFASGLTINLGRKLQEQRIERLVKVYKAIDNKSRLEHIDLRYHNGFAVSWLPEQNNIEG